MDNLKNLIKPGRVDVSFLDQQLREASIVVEPLERGYGTTLGNALRRVLLSSITGSAITSIKIEGIAHEFSTIPGVKDDVAEIILNLKALRLKTHTERPKKIRLFAEGAKTVTAKDLECHGDVEILDPDHFICTLDNSGKLNMELTVETGVGYVPAVFSSEKEQTIGCIAIDAIFSPVEMVDFSVEKTRVGQKTDYDKLILRVKTDGSIRPDDAVAQAASILREHFSIFGGSGKSSSSEVREEIRNLPFSEDMLKKIDNLELSVRSMNCLKNENIFYVGDLIQRSEQDMMRTPNFGRKSLNEIKAVLNAMGLSFGMTVPDWPPENLDALSKELDDKYS